MKNIEHIYNINLFGSISLPNVVLLDKNLTNNEKLALALFMSFHKNSEVFPVHRKAVANLMNLSMSQMNKIAGDLVEKGYLIRNDRMQKGDQNRPIIVHLFVLKEHWFHLSRKNESQPSVLFRSDNIYNNYNTTTLKGSSMKNHHTHHPLKSTLSDVEPEQDESNVLRKTKWSLWAEKIIVYWNSSGCRKHTVKSSQIYQDCLRETKLILRGKHNKLPQFSTQQIKTAIDNFAQAVTDPEYYPPKKDKLKKFSLLNFYYNPHVEGKFKSCLQHYLKNPPEPLSPMPKEKNPKLTKALMNVYTKHKLNNSSVEFTRTDKIKFIEGANRLHDFFEKNKKSVDTAMMRTNRERVEVFWQAIAEGGKEKITPAWFASDISMRRFVEYASNNGYLQNYSLRL